MSIETKKHKTRSDYMTRETQGTPDKDPPAFPPVTCITYEEIAQPGRRCSLQPQQAGRAEIRGILTIDDKGLAAKNASYGRVNTMGSIYMAKLELGGYSRGRIFF